MTNTTGFGETFSAARNASGSEKTAPMSVPIHAMWIDSIISATARVQYPLVGSASGSVNTPFDISLR